MLEVKDLHCSYGTTQVLKGVDIRVNNGEVISILGSSGSGKTTLLRCISFLQKADSGTIRFDDFEKDITKLRHNEIRALRMKMGYVFQNFNLFRNMTVRQNVLEGLITARGVDRAEAEQTADEMLEKVGMLHRKDFYPDQLSGGQQQRVAFARAIAVKPGCILFDEPLSALDALLREEMRHELTELTSALGITSVFVTHDQTEAMSMSDRIAVLNGGCVEQYAAPETVYHAPATAFVARFVGKSNWLSETEMFRPEAAAQTPGKDALHFELPVRSVQYLGSSYEITVHYQTVTWTLHTGQKTKPGDTLSVYINPDQIITFQKKKEVLSA